MALRVPYRRRISVRRTTAPATVAGLAWTVGLIFVALGIVLFQWAAADEICRWRDADGVLHFADRPPASGEADLIWSTMAGDSSGAADALPQPQPSVAPSSGVFWRIDNGRSSPSYLLGTIHSAGPRVLRWPNTVDEALPQSSCSVMEMTLEADSFYKLGRAMLLKDGHDMADLLGAADYRRLQTAMAADQVTLPRSTLHQVADLPRMTAALVDTSLDGDLDAIAALAASFVKKDHHALKKCFMQRPNDERNYRMVARMMPRIEQGGAFIAMGALHLAGSTGIVRQLAAQGYRRSPVSRI